MNENTRLEAGARLAADLRRLRERAGLSINELNVETKIPRSLLESFEERALFDHSQFNRVYLRSFVRSYATSVGVDPEVAVDALEQAFDGAYHSELAHRFLGDEAPRQEPLVSAESPAEPDAPPRPSTPVAEPPDDDEEPAAPVAAGPAEEPVDETADTAWVETSPPSRTPRPDLVPRSSRRRASTSSGSRGWLYAVAGIVAIGVLVWILVTVLRPGPAEEPAEDVALASEAEVMEPEPVQPQREIPVLGDSLAFFIVAVDGPVDPIRVTVDDDLRRPYWIEQGDSMRFAAANRIVFEERLDRIRLNLQGYAYPTDRVDERNRIVVTRDSAEAFFARLAQ